MAKPAVAYAERARAEGQTCGGMRGEATPKTCAFMRATEGGSSYLPAKACPLRPRDSCQT